MAKVPKVLITRRDRFICNHLTKHCLSLRHAVLGIDNHSRKGTERNIAQVLKVPSPDLNM